MMLDGREVLLTVLLQEFIVHVVGGHSIRLGGKGGGLWGDYTHCVTMTNLDGAATNNFKACPSLKRDTHNIYSETVYLR